MMKEQEHTAGARAAADIIMCGKEKIHTEYGFKTAEGIADLIDRKTAAPDLLAACESLLSHDAMAQSINATNRGIGINTPAGKVILAARAAIAKATPGPQAETARAVGS